MRAAKQYRDTSVFWAACLTRARLGRAVKRANLMLVE
jgi:hypothetical protein